MKTETSCHHLPCDSGVAERPRYYARQLITPDDMTLEQEYFRDKLRRHNRLLHGWGVVCGARVCFVPRASGTTSPPEFEPWLVKVQPGYVLGPYGDEIVLDCTRTVDLRTHGVSGVTGEPCADAPDPWCAEVFEPRDTGDFYVAVKYKEIKTRPVRVQPVGCGCDDTACEYSRWRDGYELCVLTECPDSHADPPDLDDVIPRDRQIPECPSCPEEPWVVLARVTVGAGGKIEEISNCECRRLILPLGRAWWSCEDTPPPLSPPPSSPPLSPPIDTRPTRAVDTVVIRQVESQLRELGPGQHTVVVSGENLHLIASVDFGAGVQVLNMAMRNDGSLVLRLEVAQGAAAGPRAMEYRDSQGNSATFSNAITVGRALPASGPAAPAQQPQKKPGKRGRGQQSNPDEV